MQRKRDSQRLSLGGLLVALGIIYGDIGTSPLYVLKAVIGDRPISENLILGTLSCIFWTLTLQTSIKYVLLTLRADNRGEGGIFALYALVRKYSRWLLLPAIIGGGALMADGIITPPISVASAIEGLRLVQPDIQTVPIVIVILIALFSVQHFGTRAVGSSLGPVMLVWFGMLAVLGFSWIYEEPTVLRSLNPRYAKELLTQYPCGFWLLGGIFLCTTGAEALYSDLGHCGRKNIQVTWTFVKMALVANYFGQGAWLLGHNGELLLSANPFYEIMPHWFLVPGICIATAATVIASQALISGSFTLAAEAMRLSVLPKGRIQYPTEHKGQIYLPAVNFLMLAGCIGVVLYFRESSDMEAAYGLAITLTMLMTTLLLGVYLLREGTRRWLVFTFLSTYLTIEGAFLLANLVKFWHGGWVTLFIGMSLATAMYIWHEGTRLKMESTEYENISEYLPAFEALSADTDVPKYATHLAFMTGGPVPKLIETKVIYSILHSNPKRADVYWFLHVNVLDVPYTSEYEVTTLIPKRVFRVDFHLGLRVEPRIHYFFQKMLHEMAERGDVDILSRYRSLRAHEIIGDIRFVVLHKKLSFSSDLEPRQSLLLKLYFQLRKFSVSEERSFGLDTSIVSKEHIPLVISPARITDLHRVEDDLNSIDIEQIGLQ